MINTKAVWAAIQDMITKLRDANIDISTMALKVSPETWHALRGDREINPFIKINADKNHAGNIFGLDIYIGRD